MMNVEDTLLVGADFSNGKDVNILTVAKRVKGKIIIINVFQGKEAEDLYRKLIAPNTL